MKRVLSGLIFATLASAQVYGPPSILQGIGIKQHMGAPVPMNVPFTDETGHDVTLQSYGGKPIVLALVYYQCPSLCNLVLSGLVRSVRPLKFEAGKDYDVVAVSFDPRENYLLARDKKASYLRELGSEAAAKGWHFLTGSDASIRLLADAVGFQYRYDPASNQFVHASGIMLLTPDGRVSRYFYGISYPERDLRLGLVEASNRTIGSVTDQVQLFCFHYDLASGKYGMAIMSVLRLGGLATLAALVGFMVVTLRRERRELPT